MKIRNAALLIAVVLASASCSWTMAGHGPDRKAWNRFDTKITPANVANLTAGWAQPLIGGAGNETIGDASIVVTQFGGALHAFDPATGSVRWNASTSAQGAPALHDKVLAVAESGATCDLRTIDATNNAPIGSVTFATQTINPPTEISLCGVNGQVVDDQGTLLVSWWHAASGLAIHCGTAWTVTTAISAYTPQLQPVLTVDRSASGCGNPPSDLLTRARFGEITRTANHYVATFGDALFATPTPCASSCASSWSTPITAPIGPAVSLPDGSIAIVNQAGVLSVLDESTGALRWTGSIGTSGAFSLAATDSFIFAAGHQTNTLYAFSSAGCGASTCTAAWSAPIGDAPASRPSIAGDVVYVGGLSSLTAYDARGCGSPTCRALAVKTIPAGVSGPSTIINGRVFVPTTAGLQTFEVPT